jgi:hypothetical protein
MIAQDHLYRLIKALQPTEKQAFTRYATRKGGEAPLYLRLFQALNSLKTYEEDQFLSSKKGQAFALNYAVQKVELYEKILQVLRVQRQSGGKEKPIEFRVREYLEDARLLREKKLVDLAEKRLAQAKEDAERYQLHEVQLELLRAQRGGVMRQLGQDDYTPLEALHAEIAQIAAIIQNKARMLQLLDPMFLQAKYQAALSGRVNHALLDTIMEAPELKNVALCLSFEANQNYHFCHAIYHQLNQRPQQAWIHARAIFLAYKEAPSLQLVKGAEYRNAVNNYLGYCVNAYRFDDFEEALKAICKGPFRSVSEEVTTVHSALAMELQKHFSLCDWAAAELVMKRYKENLNVFSEHLSSSRMMLFYLSFSRLKLVQGKWPDAARWAKKVVDEGDGDPKLGMVFQARLQELIALYEQGNMDLLTKRYRSAMYAFTRADFVGEFERNVLATIHRLPDLKTPADIRKTFESLHETLSSAAQVAQDVVSIASVWVQSHLRSIKIAQVLEEQRDEALSKLEPIL